MKYLVMILILSILLPGMVQASPADVQTMNLTNVERIWGPTRVQTAIEASKVAYANGSETVLIAGFSGEVDALTGTLLAHDQKAPLLLTDKNKVSDGIMQELSRLGVKKVIILGGENVVSKNVENELRSIYLVERIAGINREDTAIKLAKSVVGESTPHIFLALGYNQLADALAIGTVSARSKSPILLTNTNSLPAQTKEAIKSLGVKEVTIVGGLAAVSKNVEKELGNVKINRVSGQRREDTAIKIAEWYFAGSKQAIVSYGWNYADALVGGYLGAKLNSPILLTNKDALSPSTELYIKNKAQGAYVLGGESVISKSVFQDIKFASEMTEHTNYIGNANTNIFHRMKCRSLPYDHNRIYFDTRQEAVNSGRRACKICKP